MSNTLRLLASAAVALVGASVAPAQNPGIRQAPVVAPVPAMMMQQELAWQNAYRQAQLWQMYQPPVVVVNNPWATNFNANVWQTGGVSFNPWAGGLNSSPWAPGYNAPGALWNSSNTFYRNNGLTWGVQPGLNRGFR